ncbi:MAG: prephenate dehydrogenase/arogenate dehydrogenase family protein [Acidobacteria bacterium]|nr:MAG: prephenate dehydrogenase/arogenate dehydrogenase family protein [Acidobacteriota bacterium]
MPDDPRLLPMAADVPAGGPPVFERMAVVGLGLIGGSIALAARQAWPSALVIGVDRNEVLEKAMVRHAIDVASSDLMIVSEADLVILAAPVRENLALLEAVAERIAGEAVITDVGSAKRGIVAAGTALPPRVVFVGGHPLAGMARGGFDLARADLFARRPWLLTPPGEGRGEAWDSAARRVAAFVEGLGGKPETLESAEAHDRLVAFLSHLPQLTASALAGVVGEAVGEELRLAGRGLADTTRLASSPADIWRDICAANADEIGPALDRLIAALQGVRDGLGSDRAIEDLFDTANRWRETLEESINKSRDREIKR